MGILRMLCQCLYQKLVGHAFGVLLNDDWYSLLQSFHFFNFIILPSGVRR